MRLIILTLNFCSYLAITGAGCKDCYVSLVCESTTIPSTSRTTVTTTTEVVKHPWGPFYEFILYTSRAVRNATWHRSRQSHRSRESHRINFYLSSLAKALNGLGPKSTIGFILKNLSKGLKKLSKQNDNTINTLVMASYDFLTEMTHKKRDYFIAMNKLYTPVHSLKFEDYIYDLKQYLRGHTDRIGKLTRIVWKDVVFYEFYKQDKDHQYVIASLLMSAYEEYLTIDNRFAIPKQTRVNDGSEELLSSSSE